MPDTELILEIVGELEAMFPGFEQEVSKCRNLLLGALRYRNYLTAKEIVAYVKLIHGFQKLEPSAAVMVEEG